MSRPMGEDEVGGVGVDLGEAFQIALGVAGGQAGGGLGGGGQARSAPAQDLRSLAQPGEAQVIRVLLGPVEGGVGADDPQAQAVRGADGHLAGPELAAGAAGPAQAHLDVVVQSPTGDEAGGLGADRGRRLAGHEGRQVEGVGGDVAEGAAGARPVRIAAPVGLAVAGQVAGQPVLGVLGLDHPDRPQDAPRHQVPGVPDHGIAAVVVGQDEGQAGAGDEVREGPRLLHPGGQGLVADHRDPRLEEGPGGGEMGGVGGDDGDRVDPVRPGGLGPGHFGEVAIAAVRVEPQGQAEGPRPLRIRGKGAGDQGPAIVQPGGHAVDGADEGALPAADHAEAKAAVSGQGRASGGWRRRRRRWRRNRRSSCRSR
uniref:Uncharacterized protein n=1 Tax=uncultured bacterium CBNPD1 BAC clone 1664 TaxID=417310 RepID=B1N6M3_9BACT|nr:hypothetical protein [uncultured bacterium CBNPD1 BAC clone 1664]